ncbi:MAG: thioredoxin domain-containing protein, partial [Planctomycetota bacterium]|nr:thioredoxin domain-containing protein [Planctomycetota bacterium]
GKGGQDNARPSGNAVMAMNLLRISELSGDLDARGLAQATIDHYGTMLTGSSLGFGSMLGALDFAQGPREIFIAGAAEDAGTQALIQAVWRNPDPNRVVALVAPGLEKLLPPAAGKTPVDGKPAAYVCRNFTCDAPTTDPADLAWKPLEAD